jgi:pyruvate,water dikinase
VWDNANIVESYPGLTLPLTFSFVLKCYETTFFAAAMGFVWRKQEMLRHRAVFTNMIGLLRGRVYYNLLNWYKMLSFLPGFTANRRAWDQMIGIRQACETVPIRLSSTNRFACVLSMLYRLLAVRRTSSEFFAGFRNAYQRLRAIDINNLPMEGLVAYYFTLVREFGTLWRLTLYNDFSASKYYDLLKRLCHAHTFRDHPNLHNDLLCGREDIESVAPLKSVNRLGALFNSDASAASLLENEDDATVWSRISHDSRFNSLREAMESHIRSYGDRGLEELKLDTCTLRDEPSRLIGQIRAWSNGDSPLAQLKERERRIREQAITVVRERVPNPIRRAIFWFVVRKARHAITNRENMRFARTRVYGLARELFRRLGDALADPGVLAESKDIHYLSVDEILGFVNGTSVTHDARALVALRKVEYERFAADSLPSRLETTGMSCVCTVETSETRTESASKLTGVGCSSGIVEGTAVIVTDPQTVDVNEDSILIAQSTDPGWVFLMARCRGIVVERGSLLSHTAIIGRELGVPTIVGATDAQSLVPAGTRVRINGATGVVQWN